MRQRIAWLIAICLIVCTLPSVGQERENPRKIQTFTAAQMRANFAKFTQDAAFGALYKDARSKGFQQIIREDAMWGYEGVVTDAQGKEQKIFFCAYDFYNPKASNGQGCSMIWKKVGDRLYRAYLIFPEGEKDFDKAMSGAMEWFAEDDGKVQRAHSWGTCFLKCVHTNGTAPGLSVDIKNGKLLVGTSTFKINCATACFTGAIVCSGVAAVVAASTVGVPFAIAELAVCTGVTCAPCLAACAIGCM
jgi:hypothetical protein